MSAQSDELVSSWRVFGLIMRDRNGIIDESTYFSALPVK